MLIELRIKNFKVYRDEQVLSMVGTDDGTLTDNLLVPSVPDVPPLLRSAILFGTNGAGKTSFIQALRYLRYLLEEKSGKPDLRLFPPFLLDDITINQLCEIEIIFICNQMRYQYGFTTDRQHILDEWLLMYPDGQPETVFRRSAPADTLFLPHACRTDKQLTPILAWFNRIIFVASDSPARLRDVVVSIILKYDSIHAQIKEALRLADLGVTDFFIEKGCVTFLHETPHGTISLSWEDEASGVQQLFGLLGIWFLACETGSLVCIDQFGTGLHPLLIRALVEMTHNPCVNDTGAQFLLTTHNLCLLDPSLIRRDQVWFVEKDRYGASHLSSLVEFCSEEMGDWQQRYLSGRYGAIPFLEKDNSYVLS